jgi:hypothetical protein
MVLGGYPTDTSFESYEKDATALLITIPVDSHPKRRNQAEGWEYAFLQVVRPSSSALSPCCVSCFMIGYGCCPTNRL